MVFLSFSFFFSETVQRTKKLEALEAFFLFLLDFSFLRLFGWIFARNGEGKRVVFLHKGCCDSNFSIIRMNIA